jgi:hypothetical protein
VPRLEGPLFRPVREGKPEAAPPPQGDRSHPEAGLRVAKIRGRFGAHSMRATFITTALAIGASLEEVQQAAAFYATY